LRLAINHFPADARIIRDKAYYYLKNAIKEVRACGQYVFRNDKEHLEEYTSPITPRKAGRRKTEVTEVTEETVPAQAA
jgi:hypothetical protein